jgi:hypothetical protein
MWNTAVHKHDDASRDYKKLPALSNLSFLKYVTILPANIYAFMIYVTILTAAWTAECRMLG